MTIDITITLTFGYQATKTARIFSRGRRVFTECLSISHDHGEADDVATFARRLRASWELNPSLDVPVYPEMHAEPKPVTIRLNHGNEWKHFRAVEIGRIPKADHTLGPNEIWPNALVVLVDEVFFGGREWMPGLELTIGGSYVHPVTFTEAKS